MCLLDLLFGDTPEIDEEEEFLMQMMILDDFDKEDDK